VRCRQHVLRRFSLPLGGLLNVKQTMTLAEGHAPSARRFFYERTKQISFGVFFYAMNEVPVWCLLRDGRWTSPCRKRFVIYCVNMCILSYIVVYFTWGFWYLL
jgi:hypothetical protein